MFGFAGFAGFVGFVGFGFAICVAPSKVDGSLERFKAPAAMNAPGRLFAGGAGTPGGAH